jgi:hypothetical protein
MALNRSILSIAAMTAVLMCGAVPAALGQQQPPGVQTQPKPQPVNDRDIQAFAAAAGDVRQINRNWMPKIEAASKEGPDAEQKARQDALAEMTQAVQKNGLSVDRYNQIADAAETDPDVNRKIKERMQKTQ